MNPELRRGERYSKPHREASRPPLRASWGTRIRLGGYLVLWLLECVWQAAQLVSFLFTRSRIRRKISGLILAPRRTVTATPQDP